LRNFQPSVGSPWSKSHSETGPGSARHGNLIGKRIVSTRMGIGTTRAATRLTTAPAVARQTAPGNRVSSQPVSLEGKTLGIYRIGSELGRGGMGAVYRAESVADGPAGPAGSIVAIKLIHPELVADQQAFARFKLEAEIGKEIHHDHLVRTFGIKSAEAEGETHHFIVMEVIEGRDLKAMLTDLGAFPESLLYQVADQVLAALHEIHERGVVHRDIKPENIVITPDYRALLMDLGIARRQTGYEMTQAGSFVGSLVYAPPEQFAGTDVGRRADIYAFGITLYELATGRSPYDIDDIGGLLGAKMTEELAPPSTVLPDIDPFWDQVIHTCTRKEQADRFATAGELRRVLIEGRQSDWWRLKTAGRAMPSAEHALQRLRLERRSPLIGREADLEFLRETGVRAREEGAAVMISGFSGVGKSRLVYDYLESIAGAGGPAIGAGRCAGGGAGYGAIIEAIGDLLAPEDDSGDRGPAMEARLAELLADTPGVVAPMAAFLLGRLQPGPDSGLSKDALLAAGVKVLRGLARHRPVIVAIEDMHRAGDETVEFFGHVARNVPGHPIFLLGAYDLDEIVPGTPFEALIMEGPVRGRLVNVLSRAETEEIVRHIVIHERTVRALAPTLHAKSEGRPLITVETLAYLQDAGRLEVVDAGLELQGELAEIALPSTVRDLVSFKLASLDDEQRETLELASVIGADFDAALLAEVLEERPIKLLERLAGLERKHRLLQSAGKDRFRFASHQLFEAVYTSIPEAMQTEYHEIVADTMLEQDDEPAGRASYDLLRHLLAADRATAAAPFLAGALDHIASSLHAGYAAPFLERVAEAFAGAPAKQRFPLLMKLWAFYDLLASRPDQMRVLETAQEMAEKMGDSGARARVHALRAGSYWYSGDFDRMQEEAAAGLGLAREAGDRKWEATCHHTLGVVSFRRREYDACADGWKTALAIRREIGDRRGEASTLQALGLIMPAIGEGDHVLETMEESLAIWREIAERRGESAMLMNLGNRYVDLARYDEGLRYLEQAIDGHRETGARISEALALTNLGRAQDIVGRIDDARGSWTRALQHFLDLDHPQGELNVRLMSGIALTAYGEYDMAREQLELAVEVAKKTGSKNRHISSLSALGALCHTVGDRERAWEHVEAALALERESPDPNERVLTLAAAGKLALAEGDYERAAGHLAAALPDAREGRVQAPLILCRMARAQRGAGHDEEAGKLADEAWELVESTGSAPADDGPEIYYTLFELRGDENLLALARGLVESRARQIRNDTYREHYLERTWPNVEIMGQDPTADAAGS